MAGIADESLIADFVVECREHLDAIEPDLLVMEQGGPDLSGDLLNRVFRAIHSIKGGAGFLAFEALKGLSHLLESVLMQVRDGRLAVDAGLMDALFAGLDRLRAMLDDIYASDRVAWADAAERLTGILEGAGVDQGAQVPAQARDAKGRQHVFDLNAEAVRSALRKGMNLYRAAAFLHRDVKDKGLTPLAFLANAGSVGRILDAYIDLAAVPDLASCLEDDLQITLLFGTVLEADLAATALGLPEEQVCILDMDALREQVRAARTGPAKAPAAAAAQPPAPSGAKAGKGAEPGPETIRVRVDLLSSLMNQAGELVLVRNQLLRALTGHTRAVPGLAAILQNLSLVTSGLQEDIMRTRMQPIGMALNRIPRMVRDLARQLGKEIEVEIEGAEVEMDKSVVERLVDPLTHIIRNCADHAIEVPEERIQAGKPRTGVIRVEARHEGGDVVIAVADDGRGIDPAKVLAKAVARGLVPEDRAGNLTGQEVVNLVFAPGFSTAEAVTEVSGRGVGMDVVRTNTEQLGGTVALETQAGAGTTVRLRLPLTLAIIPSMIVGAAGQRFAIPQVGIAECVWVRAEEVRQRIERIQGAEALRLRGQLLPLVRLADVLDLARTYLPPGPEASPRPDRRQRLADRRSAEADGPDAGDRGPGRREHWRSDYSVVVLRLGGNRFGVVVDDLHDLEEIVVKPLPEAVRDCTCCSGATILGDGRVVTILDPAGLAAKARLRFTSLQAEAARRGGEERARAAAAPGRRRRVVLCTGAPGEPFAIAQDRIERLERIPVAAIQTLGDRSFVAYRGSGLPLIRLDQYLDVGPLPPDREDRYLVIPRAAPPGAAGILVSDLVDTLEVDVDLQPVAVKGPGVLGGALVQGRFTLFLDPQALLQAAGVGGTRP
jgi:two-component system chemotaxis sensor kinase CheA